MHHVRIYFVDRITRMRWQRLSETRPPTHERLNHWIYASGASMDVCTRRCNDQNRAYHCDWRSQIDYRSVRVLNSRRACERAILCHRIEPSWLSDMTSVKALSLRFVNGKSTCIVSLLRPRDCEKRFKWRTSTSGHFCMENFFEQALFCLHLAHIWIET